jgi:hypothetical protein
VLYGTPKRNNLSRISLLIQAELTAMPQSGAVTPDNARANDATERVRRLAPHQDRSFAALAALSSLQWACAPQQM